MTAIKVETCAPGLCFSGRMEEVRGGEPIFFRGDLAQNAYRVIQGQVRLFAPTDYGGKFLPQVLKPPSLFGVNSTRFGGFYRLSAEAVTECRLLVISAKDLKLQMAGDPEFAIEILKSVAAKTRSAEIRKAAILRKKHQPLGQTLNSLI